MILDVHQQNYNKIIFIILCNLRAVYIPWRFQEVVHNYLRFKKKKIE